MYSRVHIYKCTQRGQRCAGILKAFSKEHFIHLLFLFICRGKTSTWEVFLKNNLYKNTSIRDTDKRQFLRFVFQMNKNLLCSRHLTSLSQSTTICFHLRQKEENKNFYPIDEKRQKMKRVTVRSGILCVKSCTYILRLYQQKVVNLKLKEKKAQWLLFNVENWGALEG